MNLVLDDAEEVNVKKKTKKTLGKSLRSNEFPLKKLLVHIWVHCLTIVGLFFREDPFERRQYYSDDEYVSKAGFF